MPKTEEQPQTEAAEPGSSPRSSVLYRLVNGDTSAQSGRKVSPESMRQSTVLTLSLLALLVTAYTFAAHPGARSFQIMLAASAGGWLFLVIHAARAGAEARRM